MAKEGFFRKIKNFLFGESEEAITEFSQPEEADVSIQDAEISEIPSFKFSPTTEGTTDAPAEFYTDRVDGSREAPPIPEQYRVEHEPYRYEPDGDKRVCISKAHLYEMHPKSNLCVEKHALEPLTIKASRECVIYSEFNTDEQGKVIADPDNPDGALYRLAKSKELPDSIQFELPDESGYNGKEGKYSVPIVWVKDGKLYRHQWNEEKDGREARLYGSLEGIRGPLHWHRGYNKIKNLGAGKNVYKKYVRQGKDEKEFRSINERAQSGLSSPFTGDPQVKVKYNGAQADATEIHVTGNEFNKHWKIDGKGVAVVEDGLVTCLNDLTCVELNKTTVLSAASGTTTVLTAGSTTSVAQMPTEAQFTAVLTSSGTVTVALEPTNSNMATVVSAGAVTTAAAPVTAGNLDTVVGVVDVTYTTTAAPVTTGNFTSVSGVATTTTVATGVTSGNMASVISSTGTTTVAAPVTTGNFTSVSGVATTTTVATGVTSGNMASVISSTGTTTVAAPVTTGNFTSVSGVATTTTVATGVTSGNMASVLSSDGTTPVALAPDSTTDMVTDVWRGGASTAGGGMTPVKVAGCGTTDSSGNYTQGDCVWVLGVAATGQYATNPPTFPTLITGASTTSVVKSLSTTNVVDAGSPVSVVQSVPTTVVLNSAASTTVVQSIPTTGVISAGSPVSVVQSVPTTTVLNTAPPVEVVQSIPTHSLAYQVALEPSLTVVTSTTGVSVLSSSSTVSVVASLPTSQVATAGNTVNVVKDLTPVDVVTSTNTTAVLTTGTTVEVYAPTGSLSEPIKVVECPQSSLCPEPE